MALQRRFAPNPDILPEMAAESPYAPGAVKPGLVRRGGISGTAERPALPGLPELITAPPVPPPAPTPESGPYTPVDTSAWNTDGYQAPTFQPTAKGGPMAGWDATKWANNAHQTPKYGVGRILSNYAPTVAGLAQALPEIQRAYPGVTFDGKDKLMIPGVGTIDVLVGASQGGSGWAWQDMPERGVTPYARPSAPTSTPTQVTEQPSVRNSVLEMLEADGRKPLRTAQYLGREAF